MGPRAKAVEQVVYEHAAYIKHTPVQERLAKIATLRVDGARYFLSDFEAYESHFISAFMDICECELFRYVLSEDEHVELMNKILMGRNFITTRSGIRVRVTGRRMSGEMSTSVSNGFTNHMMQLFLLEKKGDKHVRLFVEGDDAIISTTADVTVEDYTKLGFTCKLVEVNDPCECLPLAPPDDPKFGRYKGAFCGVCCTSDGIIIRDPRAFMMNFGWTSSFIHAGQQIMDELARAKALSACYETPQCPIIGAMARRVLKETSGAAVRFVYDGYHQVPNDSMHVPDFEPSPEARLLFEKQFGIGVNIQLAAEKRIFAGDFDIADLIPPTPDQAWFAARYVERS